MRRCSGWWRSNGTVVFRARGETPKQSCRAPRTPSPRHGEFRATWPSPGLCICWRRSGRPSASPAQVNSSGSLPRREKLGIGDARESSIHRRFFHPSLTLPIKGRGPDFLQMRSISERTRASSCIIHCPGERERAGICETLSPSCLIRPAEMRRGLCTLRRRSPRPDSRARWLQRTKASSVLLDERLCDISEA